MTEDPRLISLEEQIMHQARVIEELSEVVRRQDKDIAQLKQRVDLLMRRAAEAETETEGSIPLADQKPPHW